MGFQRASTSYDKTCHQLDLRALNRKWEPLLVTFSATHYPGWGYVVYCHRLPPHPPLPLMRTIRSKTTRGIHQAVTLRMRALCNYEEV